jgi:hypothetical protein
LEILLDDRERLVTLAETEARPYTKEELQQLVEIDQAITAIVNSMRHAEAGTDLSASPPQPVVDRVSDYRLQALKYFDALREDATFAKTMMGDYGKWMLATLAAVHVGGIYLVNSMTAVEMGGRIAGMWWLLIGLLLNLAAGLVTYANWNLLAQFTPKIGMLVNEEQWPKSWPLNGWVNVTMWGAILLGVASALTLIPTGFALNDAVIMAEVLQPTTN